MSTKVISDELRALVKEKLAAKVSPSILAKTFNISRSSIYRISKGDKIKRRGRKKTYEPKKLSLQVRNAVQTLTRKKKKVTASIVRHYISESVSLRTLQNLMQQDEKLLYKRIAKKIILSQCQKKKRVTQIRDWFTNRIDFEKVVFSDEVLFSLDGPNNTMTWQIPGLAEGFCRHKRRFNGGGLLVHGFLDLDGHLHVNRVDGTIDSKKYIHLLNVHVIPTLTSKYGKKFTLQQDNAPPHVSKVTKDFFSKSKIKTLQWPPYSPDLSIIENVWKMLKDVLYDGSSYESKGELWSKLQGTVINFNASKAAIVQSMRKNVVNRYLDVLMKNGSN